MREEVATGQFPVARIFRLEVLRQAIFLGILAGISAGVTSLVLPKSYLASAKILPSVAAPSLAGSEFLQMAGLTTSLGAALSGENPILTYPEILASNPVVQAVLLRQYPPGTSQLVIDAAKAKGSSDRERLYQGRKALLKMMRVSANVRSGIIDIGVVAQDSVFAAFLANSLVDELQRFNVTSRSSSARAAREFAETRLLQSRDELGAAERALASFRESNVRFTNSPKLQMDQARLEREVESKADVYRLLTREFEMSRLQESRNTPTFTILENATPPYRKYRPRTLLNSIAASAAAMLLWFGFAWWREARTRGGRGATN